ncbi:chorismate mutase aro7 [Saitoella coloradoensis]
MDLTDRSNSIHAADHSVSMDLNDLRYQLIRLEDTIIFSLIERAQFKQNKLVYTPNGIPLPDFKASFLDWVVQETEVIHAKVRRYQSPDEYAFTANLPEPILPPLTYPRFLHPNDINVNDKIKDYYVERIIPAICEEGDDVNYGSAATIDIQCLQALSRRIHYGKYVAEVKYRSDPEKMNELIRARDVAGLDAAITNAAVEKQVLERLGRKARAYGRDPVELNNDTTGAPARVDVDTVVSMYRDWVIPLTKEVEVDYLLRRLDNA